MLNPGEYSSQRGISLVELLVGMTISLVVLGAALSASLAIAIAMAESVQAAWLNQQLRGAMDLMARELQRSGYVNWRASWQLTDTNGDGVADIRDFYQAVTPLMREMGEVTIGANGSCILYSYDIDGDGGKSTDNFEQFGFRLVDGAIQMKTAGAHDCVSAGWQAVTDGVVTVTGLAFELDSYQGATSSAAMYPISGEGIADGPVGLCAPTPAAAGALPGVDDTLCVERRSVRISVAAQLASDPAVTVMLENRVRLRNDRFNPFQPED